MILGICLFVFAYVLIAGPRLRALAIEAGRGRWFLEVSESGTALGCDQHVGECCVAVVCMGVGRFQLAIALRGS